MPIDGPYGGGARRSLGRTVIFRPIGPRCNWIWPDSVSSGVQGRILTGGGQSRPTAILVFRIKGAHTCRSILRRNCNVQYIPKRERLDSS